MYIVYIANKNSLIVRYYTYLLSLFVLLSIFVKYEVNLRPSQVIV